ncbi:hypothetical protein RRG08_035874 [Elysia crispata]|uniref:Uncharacterized protein n=1 Tax=Elysia crispata TaxID=231223 RepID=A0AAE1A1W6_9GAST|nr:hypothetical protein RRG08_035874 [Elysia crispata]
MINSSKEGGGGGQRRNGFVTSPKRLPGGEREPNASDSQCVIPTGVKTCAPLRAAYSSRGRANLDLARLQLRPLVLRPGRIDLCWCV